MLIFFKSSYTHVQDCQIVVAWTNNGETFDFEVQATELDADNGRGWVAAAWSEDPKMGEDMAVLCDEIAGVNLYWLVGKGAASTVTLVGVSMSIGDA